MNVSSSSPSLLFPEQFSKRFVVGEALVERDDSVPNEYKNTVGNLCVEVCALTSAEFKVLLAFVEQDFNIPVYLVAFKGIFE